MSALVYAQSHKVSRSSSLVELSPDVEPLGEYSLKVFTTL